MAADKVYVILVTGQLKPGNMQKFIEIFTPLAKYVEQNEQGAHTYQLCLGDEDPDKLIIYERYVNKEFLEKVHWESAAYKNFGAQCKELNIEWVDKNVAKYFETDIGFMTRKA